MEVNGYRVWQEVPVLLIVSVLSYFCFLNSFCELTICLGLCINSIRTCGSLCTCFLLLGFGVAMSGSSILVEFYRWRRRRALSDQHHSSQVAMHPCGGRPQTAMSSHVGPQVQQTERENAEIFSVS